MEKLLYKIALTKIPKVGAKTARDLVSYCGGVENVFRATKKELLAIPGIGLQIAKCVLEQNVLSSAERELKFIEQHQIQPLFFLDAAYPARLKHHNDSPVMLYYKGNADLNHGRVIAIVGTRKPTARGIASCEQLIEGLLPYQPLIVSGLAYGVDVTAHRKCLEVGIETVGIMGHGLNQIYPPAHRKTASEMIENGGLLTEYTHDTAIDPRHFPMRNRIIAGLCDALIVVETKNSGGSMISANIANGYNKDVFAFPGRVSDKSSEGCNKLIKSHKAALIESAEDIAYVMRWEKSDSQRTIQKQLFVELSERERKVVSLLRSSDNVSIDKIVYEQQISTSQAAAVLLELELKGLVKPQPGNRFVLV
ncbi:MAG: DNA-processing protein DprA [Saprospiraceae bacterium]